MRIAAIEFASIAADPAAAGRKMALYCLRDLGGNDEDVFRRRDWRPPTRGSGWPRSRASAVCRRCRRSEVDALLAAVTSDTDAGMRRAATVALRDATNDEARVRPVLERLRAQSFDPDLARAAERALTALAAARGAK